MMTNGDHFPWTKNETGPFIQTIRPYFHYLSWEYGGPQKMPKGRSLDDPDWEHPLLVSVAITRDPLSRLLASDGGTKNQFPGWNKGQLPRNKWWDYAAYSGNKNTDNFFLRILTKSNMSQRTSEQRAIRNHVDVGINCSTKALMELFPTTIHASHYEHGKDLLDGFTVVLDIACLDEGMAVLADLLHLENYGENYGDGASHKQHATPRERIGYDDVYEYLLAKNQWDIALYEYSKTISLIRCNELPPKQAPPPPNASIGNASKKKKREQKKPKNRQLRAHQ
jgi:hypothetical protein